MDRRPRLVRFRSDDPTDVVAGIEQLRAVRAGWVNFRPYIAELDGEIEGDDDTEYERPRGSTIGIGGMLLTPAPPVPECTWVPGGLHRRKGVLPDSLGLQHPSGKRAGRQITEGGMRLPDGWRVVADNARRGLVLELPPDYDVAATVRWLLDAAALVTPFDLPDEWVAEVHPS